jgi:hypothetical protein
LLHGGHALGEALEGAVVDPLGGQAGCDRLEESPNLDDLENGVALDEIDREPDPLEQQVGFQARGSLTTTAPGGRSPAGPLV